MDAETRCEKCGGAGWLWGHELDDPSEDTLADTMTRYSCDGCRGEPPRPVAVQPDPETPNATEPREGGLLKQDPLDPLSSEMQRFERENAALKSELGAKNARLSEALDRIAQLEREEDLRRSLLR